MGKKVNLTVLISLILAVLCSGQALAEEVSTDMTTVTTVDYRYNNQAPVGYFEVLGVDGKTHIAFCGWHEKKMPEKGWKMTTLDVYTAANKKNENLRKVLWYGFDGPGSIGANYAQTALAASVALGHMDTDDTGETEGPIGKTFLAQVKGMEAPPEEFQVYCVRNLEETEYQYQCLVYSVYNPNGKVKVIKKSTVPEIVEGNSCYSLSGAVYGIFEDEACKNKVGEITTNSEGETEELELKTGTYYLKELQAPQGYKLDEKVYKIDVASQQLAEVLLSDEPCFMDIDLILTKYDCNLGYTEEGNKAQGAASLSGAEYQISFYGGDYNTIEEIEKNEPLKQWLMRTDEDGKIYFQQEYVIEGDDMWTDQSGKNVLPAGTLVIQEKKASEGYMVNTENIITKIAFDAYSKEVLIFNTVQAPEEVIKGNVLIHKFYYGEDQVTKIPMKDVVFVFTSKTRGDEYRVKTNTEGNATTEELGGLPYDTYVVEEENTPEGYERCEGFEVVIDGKEDILTYEIENKIIEKEDSSGTVKTGDMQNSAWYYGAMLAAVIITGAVFRQKHKKRHNS